MVYAAIAKTDLLSGHGDHNDLMNTIKSQDSRLLKSVFLVHGESKSMNALADGLSAEGYKVIIPLKGQDFEL